MWIEKKLKIEEIEENCKVKKKNKEFYSSHLYLVIFFNF